MLIWLGIGGLIAAVALFAPIRYAASVAVFCVPFSATAVAMLGKDPIVFPLLVLAAFAARLGFTMLLRPERELIGRLLPNDFTVLLFVGWCLVSGVFFPRLFAGQTDVLTQESVLGFHPLSPAMVSYPQLLYLVIAVVSYLGMRYAILISGLRPVVYALMAQAAFIGVVGLLQTIFGFIGQKFPVGWIVNNTAYALMTDKELGGFARVSSVFPEASSFATYALGPLAFFYAMYVNRVYPTICFLLMGMLGIATLLSTSTTAYAGLAALGCYAALHSFLDPDKKRRDRGLLIVVVGGVLTAIALLFVLTAEDGFLSQLRSMIEDMTVNKAKSDSGVERGSWAAQSVKNAFETGLLGVGYGAARSSGLLAVLFGTTGLVGLILFFIMLFQFMAPAFKRAVDDERGIVAAASFSILPVFAVLAAAGSEIGLSQIFWALAALSQAPLRLRERLLADQAATRVAMTTPAGPVVPLPDSAAARGRV